MNLKVKTADKTKSYTIPSFYNAYIDDIEKNTVYDIPYEKYRKIVVDYFKYIQDLLIEESKCVKLPYRLGSIQIVKHRPKFYDKRSLRLDYQACKKYNKMVFLTNEHSDFYKFRCYWMKLDMLVTNKTHYLLILTRANKRYLALIIKNKIHDYEEL